MDHSAWDGRAHDLGQEDARGRNEDFERTVALGGPGTDGAMGETLPLYAAEPEAARPVMPVPRQGGDEFGDDYGEYSAVPHARPGDDFDGDGGFGESGDGGGPGRPGRRFSRRRILFAAGGLTLLGGCGIAAAVKLSASGSASAAAPAPSPSHTASPVAAATHSPSDLSSSAAGPPSSPPPDVTNPGSGINPRKVQSEPEYYVHAGPKVIALTLDDGPNNVYTPQILELLQQYRIQATFCMIGRQVAENQSLVREVVAAGHAVANHTWDHADQSRLSLSSVRSEIARTNDALAAVNIQPEIFRAPYGAWSYIVYEACALAALRPLDWSVDPRDWSRPGVSTIVTRILQQTRTGSIILEHDGGGDRSQTVAALKIVLPKLLDAGYRFTQV
ncbi:polysaccharide deacetylase family protein [Actinocrinis sp.]|uniref:polysaccharide deacetylase family protein n=1 Tax=Actinocrinis sp. TaxID=1920516 RepID=UPI002DDD1764|nr:polysaccharide deacetylase family protein [Actinocrinis sp.]